LCRNTILRLPAARYRGSGSGTKNLGRNLVSSAPQSVDDLVRDLPGQDDDLIWPPRQQPSAAKIGIRVREGSPQPPALVRRFVVAVCNLRSWHRDWRLNHEQTTLCDHRDLQFHPFWNRPRRRDFPAVIGRASPQSRSRSPSRRRYPVSGYRSWHSGWPISGPIDMNDRGEVTGVSTTAGDTTLRGFVWRRGVWQTSGPSAYSKPLEVPAIRRGCGAGAI
jgi:hypothetical protein